MLNTRLYRHITFTSIKGGSVILNVEMVIVHFVNITSFFIITKKQFLTIHLQKFRRT